MADYLLNAKSLSESLSAAGASLPDSNLIDYITDGLGLEFKKFVTSLHFQTSITFDDVYDMLLQVEQFMKRTTMSDLTTQASPANISSSSQPPNSNGGRFGG